ncbi:hypothetical protein JAAARDRAFT_80566 [Jaapia argillacea MUCL 33604]|uniref:F-box domain-containing protein n=1 Tax=Jaapia argillacea MUCL 33604 TaxID=933084 RepID=A0A067PQY5_9AGAM|nr:hypothetical protein JAAARDRAFT_80566 [Jaapia argillacea MUCL 33604]
MSASDNVPIEIWRNIFQMLPRSDLRNVLQANRQCHDIALPVLYRDIVWNDPVDLANHLPFWDSHSDKTEVPRSLVVAVSPPRNWDADSGSCESSVVVGVDGPTNSNLAVDRTSLRSQNLDLSPHSTSRYFRYEEPELLASPYLYHRMCSIIPSFRGLDTLTFRNTVLPETFFSIVHNLPSLRTLHIQGVIFTMYAAPGTQNHRELPITELTLWGLSNRQERNETPLLLATAANLRTLRVDSTADVFTLYNRASHTGARGNLVPAVVVPNNLTNVYMRLPPLPYDNLRAPAKAFVASYLEFLRRHGSTLPLQRLSTSGAIRSDPLPDNYFPQLRSLRGHLDVVLPFLGNASHRPLETLDISEGIKTAGSLTDVLGQVDGAHRIKTLCLSLPSWDTEILHAVAQLFPGLRRLKITYDIGVAPSDLLFVGPICLAYLPSLEIIQLYRDYATNEYKTPPPAGLEHLPDHIVEAVIQHYPAHLRPPPPPSNPQPILTPPPFVRRDERARDLLAGWSRSSKSLKEAQFESNRVWRRAGPGHEWNVRNVRGVDGHSGEVYV